MSTTHVLPGFRLPDERGGWAGTQDLLQQRDIVLALLHPGCEACAEALDALARLKDALEARGAGAFAVLLGPRAPGERLPDGGIAHGHDADGRLGALLAERLELPVGQAALVCADRYGRVMAMLPVHGRDADALADDALGWIDFIQEQCPECGAPEW